MTTMDLNDNLALQSLLDAATEEAAPPARAEEAAAQTPRLNPFLHRIPVTLTLEAGSARVTLQELAELRPDSVLPLNAAVGEPLIIKVNGAAIGKGEVVVCGDSYGLKVVERLPLEVLHQESPRLVLHALDAHAVRARRGVGGLPHVAKRVGIGMHAAGPARCAARARGGRRLEPRVGEGDRARGRDARGGLRGRGRRATGDCEGERNDHGPHAAASSRRSMYRPTPSSTDRKGCV
jgi:flagellar motor switch protein FliN/FliY